MAVNHAESPKVRYYRKYKVQDERGSNLYMQQTPAYLPSQMGGHFVIAISIATIFATSPSGFFIGTLTSLLLLVVLRDFPSLILTFALTGVLRTSVSIFEGSLNSLIGREGELSLGFHSSPIVDAITFVSVATWVLWKRPLDHSGASGFSEDTPRMFVVSTLVTTAVLEISNPQSIASQLVAEDNSEWNRAVSQIQDGLVPDEVGGSKFLPHIIRLVYNYRDFLELGEGQHWAAETLSTTQLTYAVLFVIGSVLYGNITLHLFRQSHHSVSRNFPVICCALMPIVLSQLFYSVGALTGLAGCVGVALLILVIGGTPRTGRPGNLTTLIGITFLLALLWWPLLLLAAGVLILVLLPVLFRRISHYYPKGPSILAVLLLLLALITLLLISASTVSGNLRNPLALLGDKTPLEVPASPWIIFGLLSLGLASLSSSAQGGLEHRRLGVEPSIWLILLGPTLLLFLAASLLFGPGSYGMLKWTNVVLVPLLCVVSLVQLASAKISKDTGRILLLVLGIAWPVFAVGDSASELMSPSSRAGNLRMQTINSIAFEMVSSYEVKGVFLCAATDGSDVPESYTLSRASYYCSRNASAFSIPESRRLTFPWTLAMAEFGAEGMRDGSFGRSIPGLLDGYLLEVPIYVFYFGDLDENGFPAQLPVGLSWIRDVPSTNFVFVSVKGFENDPGLSLLGIEGFL